MGVADNCDHSNAMSREPTSKDTLVNIFYLKPMIGDDLLEKSEYDVEIVKWIDGSTNDYKINKMVLRPIEAGNMVELCKGREAKVSIITSPYNY
jgi:hypothetical protein